MLQEAFSPQKKSVEVSSLRWHFHACVLESMKIEKKNCYSTEGENRFWKGYKEKAKLMIQMQSNSISSAQKVFLQ